MNRFFCSSTNDSSSSDEGDDVVDAGKILPPITRGKKKIPSQPYSYHRHLSLAISSSKINFYLKYPKKWATRFPDLPFEYLHCIDSGFVNNVNIPHWIAEQIETSPSLSVKGEEAMWIMLVDTVFKSLSIQLKLMCGSLAHYSDNQLLDYKRALLSSVIVRRAFHLKLLILKIHAQIHHDSEARINPILLGFNLQMNIHSDFVLLKTFPGRPLLVPYSLFLNVLDRLEAKFSFLVYAVISDLTPKKKDSGFLTLSTALYNILNEMSLACGNVSANLLKCLDPIGIGVVLQTLDEETNDHVFLEENITEVSKEHPLFPLYTRRILNLYREHMTRYGDKGKFNVLEQYGQEKLHYYPIVSAEDGMIKMYAYGTMPLDIKFDACTGLTGDFCREYICNYYIKEGSLPDIVPDVNYCQEIKQILETGIPGSVKHCTRIPRHEWAKILFRKNHQFNYHTDILDLVDDKAITPHLQFIHQLFAADALDVLNQKAKFPRKHTRLIDEILSRKEINIREFYLECERMNYIPANWAVIQLMAKERELKISAREFSILTFECRMMASVCERNISSSIFKFFDSQTMSMSGSELKHKIDQLITLSNSPSHTWVFFHCDIEQWNYTFRQQMQVGVATKLNQLFGVRHFDVPRTIFGDSILISADQYTPPGIPGTFSYWGYHAGGNQGICQKFWTIITILLIRHAMNRVDLEFKLIGAGDNQVLAVKIPVNSVTANTVLLVKKELKTAFQDVGLKLKLVETWHSSSVFNYQRTYYFQGQQADRGIKQAIRAAAGSSSITGGLNDLITTAMNTGTSIISATSDPLSGPIFAYLEAFIQLMYNPLYNTRIPLDPQVCIMLTMLGSEFGFLPFTSLPSFAYAGHQDHLSESLALLKKLWESEPGYRSLISGILLFERGDASPEARAQMVVEPQSLNIKKPPSSESIIKAEVQRYLHTNPEIQNTQLKELFSKLTPDLQMNMATQLLNIKPIDLRLAHILYENSLVGSVVATANRFTRVNTLVKNAERLRVSLNASGFAEQVRLRDLATLRYIIARTRRIPPKSTHFISQATYRFDHLYRKFCLDNDFAEMCSFSLRLFLVGYTYHYEGQRILGPFTPSPLEQSEIVDTRVDLSLGNYLVVTPAYNIPSTLSELENTRGPYQMFIGSSTQSSIRTVRITQLNNIVAGDAIKQYIKLYAWLTVLRADPKILSFIVNSIKQRMDASNELIDSLCPGISGGTYEHRLLLVGLSTGAELNSGSNVSTWYQISSNKAEALSRGAPDRYIFFQQIIHHTFSVLRNVIPYHTKIYVRVHLDHCSYKTVEPKFSLVGPLSIPAIDNSITLSLTPEHIGAVLNEANHNKELRITSALLKCPPLLALAAHTGFIIASSIKRYQLGFDIQVAADSDSSTFFSSLNITVIRLIPMRDLFTHLTFHMAISGAYGRFRGLAQLKNKIAAYTNIGHTSQNLILYREFIDSLITSSRIQDLIRFTKGTWGWSGTPSILGILQLIFTGMVVAIDEIINNQPILVLLIECRSSKFSYKSTLLNLRNWSAHFLKLEKVNPGKSPKDILDLFNSVQKKIIITILSDRVDLLEHGRRLISDPTHPPTTSDAYRANASSTPTSMKCPVMPFFHWNQQTLPLTEQGEIIQYQRENIYELRKITPEHLHQAAKWPSITSSSRYKLLEIINHVEWDLSNSSLFCCFAEGNGSFLSTLSHIAPKAKLLYNSLIKGENIPSSMMNLYCPPELMCSCNLETRLLDSPESCPLSGDLTRRESWTYLINIIKLSELSVSVLTLDMEHTTALRYKIFQLLEVATLIIKPERLIVKCYLADLSSIELLSITTLMNCYSNYTIIKPSSGSIHSTEFYILLSNYLGKPLSIVGVDWTLLLDVWEQNLSDFSWPVYMEEWNKILKWTCKTNMCRTYEDLLAPLDKSPSKGVNVIMRKLISTSFSHWLEYSVHHTKLLRSEQSVVRAQTSASVLFQDHTLVLLSMVCIYWKLINPGGRLETKSAVEEYSIEMGRIVYNYMQKLDDKVQSPGAKILVWKLYGYLMTYSCSSSLEEELRHLQLLLSLLDTPLYKEKFAKLISWLDGDFRDSLTVVTKFPFISMLSVFGSVDAIASVKLIYLKLCNLQPVYSFFLLWQSPIDQELSNICFAQENGDSSNSVHIRVILDHQYTDNNMDWKNSQFIFLITTEPHLISRKEHYTVGANRIQTIGGCWFLSLIAKRYIHYESQQEGPRAHKPPNAQHI